MAQQPHMQKIRTQPELERILENRTGFLRNDGTWHSLASLQPTLGMCGTEEAIEFVKPLSRFTMEEE